MESGENGLNALHPVPVALNPKPLARCAIDLDRPEGPVRLSRTMKISRFEDLDCWKEARVLAQKVYDATEDKRFGRDMRLAGQIQAAAASSMANIAEGLIRRSDKEFIQFLFIAMSSTAEVQSHLYIAFDRGYIGKESFDDIYGQANKTGKLISGLITYLLRSNPKSTKPTKRTK